jgi:hypothetical protein
MLSLLAKNVRFAFCDLFLGEYMAKICKKQEGLASAW